MGDRTIEEVLGGSTSGNVDAGLTIEDVLNTASLGPAPRVSGGRPVNPIDAYNAKFNPTETDLRVMGIKGALAGLGTTAGGMVGVRAAASIPYATGPGVGPAAVRAFLTAMGEAGGNMAGSTLSDIGTGAVTGAPIDWKGNLISSGMTGGLSLAGAAAIPLLGKMGGVPKGRATAPVGRPDFVKPVPQSAEFNLAADINDAASGIPLTQGKQTLNKLIDMHDAAGMKIRPGDIYDAMIGARVPGSSVEARTANRMLMRDIAEMERHYGNSPRSAKQISDMIEESLTRPVAKELEGKVGGSQYKQARLEARNLAAQTLYRKLPPPAPGTTPFSSASEAGASAHADLKAANAVKEEFPLEPDTGIPKSGAASRVAQAGSSTDIEAPRVLEILGDMDRRFGTTLVRDAVELGTKRDWAPKDARMAEYIVNTMQVGKGRVPQVGGTRDFFRMLARHAVRSQGKFGAVRRSIYGQAVGSAFSGPSGPSPDEQRQYFEDIMRRPNP